MKKTVLLFLILALTSLSATPTKRERSDFTGSVIKLQIQADSLNSTIKKYNEKH